MRGSCRHILDVLDASLTSLQWQYECELHVLPAALLARAPSLKRMAFSGRPGRPSVLVADLSPLSVLMALQQLDCSHSLVTDLAPLSTLTTLRELNCSGLEALNNLTPLAGLRNLTSLNLCSSALLPELHGHRHWFHGSFAAGSIDGFAEPELLRHWHHGPDPPVSNDGYGYPPLRWHAWRRRHNVSFSAGGNDRHADSQLPGCSGF